MKTNDIKTISGVKMMIRIDNTNLDAMSWTDGNKDFVESILSTSGALLVRGLNIAGGEEFGDILRNLFGEELSAYTYRSTPRTQINSSNVYTASEYHPSETIPQHNENSYSNSWPMRIGFLCKTVADKMGNTPISDSRVAYREIPEDIREEFEKKGVMYVRNYLDIDLPWTEVFQTKDKKVVEKYCKKNNLKFEWIANGLRTRQVNQATTLHPTTNEKLWFNQAHLFHISNLDDELREGLIELAGEENLPRNTYFGDGTPMDTEMLSIIRNVYERTKFSFQWEKNDLLLLDNMLFTHGREPFEGSREILVGMAREYRL